MVVAKLSRKGVLGARSAPRNRFTDGDGSSPVWAFFATVALGLGFFAIVSLGLVLAYRLTTTSQLFALSEVSVRGNERLSASEVLSSAGVGLGENCLAMPMAEIRARLMRNPWIRTASLKRELPDRMEITVVERAPRFWVRQGEAMYYADEYGRLIARVEPVRFTPLPILVAEAGTERLLDDLPAMVEELKSADTPFRLEEADWVRLTKAGGLEVYFSHVDRRLSVSAENFSRNLWRLKCAWSDLARRGELSLVRGIRVHGENVWVTTKSAG